LGPAFCGNPMLTLGLEMAFHVFRRGCHQAPEASTLGRYPSGLRRNLFAGDDYFGGGNFETLQAVFLVEVEHDLQV